VTLVNFGSTVYAIWFSYSLEVSKYLTFQSFDFEHPWWSLYFTTQTLRSSRKT